MVPLISYLAVGDDGEDERCIFKPNPEIADHPGHLQLRHEETGLLVNTKCFHGLKLPEAGGDISRIHWNGKTTHWFDLVCLRETPEGMHPVVKCRHCGHMYRESWAAVLPFVKEFDEILYARLGSYAINLKEPELVWPSTYITKAQRKILIESYLECQDEMGAEDHS